jgi:uncharacterized protein (DUF2267 family)
MDENRFFREVARRLACDERRAEAVTFVVFRELRDRLPAKEATDVEAQLPTALKRLWGRPLEVGGPAEKLHAPEFVGHVRLFAGLPDEQEAERAVRAVFATLQHVLGSATGKEGEAWDVFSVLPKDLKLMWLSAAERGA